MNTGYTKVTNLKDAIRSHVKDGCHLSLGGFTINSNPMAAVYEIIRQKIKHLIRPQFVPDPLMPVQAPWSKVQDTSPL